MVVRSSATAKNPAVAAVEVLDYAGERSETVRNSEKPSATIGTLLV
ncbi:hypothetical protein [Halococcus sediminicola]|nr:hypothetical protein [Halococcus sediminicola]